MLLWCFCLWRFHSYQWVFGMLIVGVIFSSRYAARIREFKLRLLGKLSVIGLGQKTGRSGTLSGSLRQRPCCKASDSPYHFHGVSWATDIARCMVQNWWWAPELLSYDLLPSPAPWLPSASCSRTQFLEQHLYGAVKISLPRCSSST